MSSATKGLLLWIAFTIIVVIGVAWAFTRRKIKWPEILIILVTYGLLWAILAPSLYVRALQHDAKEKWKREHPGQHYRGH